MIETRREPTFSPDVVTGQPPPPRRRKRSWLPVLLALLLAALAVAWFWIAGPDFGREEAAAPAAPPAEVRPPPTETIVEAPLAPLPSTEPPVQSAGVAAALTELLGREAVLKFLETTDFPRRAVATLDNLGREHAPVAAWPVQPTPGRFQLENSGTAEVMAAQNAARYQPFVRFVGALDADATVRLYRRMYPLLQQTYREQGFGDRSLHQRLVQVIDLLLATPRPGRPPELVLTEVKGPIAPTQPWTRYEFADPKLQSLSAGQKILLRVGPENRRVLEAKLRELRAKLLEQGAAR